MRFFLSTQRLEIRAGLIGGVLSLPFLIGMILFGLWLDIDRLTVGLCSMMLAEFIRAFWTGFARAWLRRNVIELKNTR